MDFEALLAEHGGGYEGGGGGGGGGGDDTLDRLDAPLSAPRDAGGYAAGGFHGGRDAGDERRRGRARRSRKPRRDAGGRGDQYEGEGPGFGSGRVEETEPGTLKYVAIWGDYPKWDEEKWKSEEAGNVLVQFEAMGADNIVVALAPQPKLITPMYEIVIGGWKDTKSVIRREAQGMERALSTQPRLCSGNEFRSYWALLKNGVVRVGVGEQAGKSMILAWRDPEPVPAQYISFTTWDRSTVFRNVRVSSVGEDMEMDEFERSTYVPDYLAKLEEERAHLKERAERFGTSFVEPDPKDLADRVLSDAERAQLKQQRRDPAGAGLATGFVTGFDPTTEEERKKAEDRAKRFGTAPAEPGAAAEGMDEDVEAMMSRERREARASRFQIPLLEDKRIGDGLIRDLTGLHVQRRDPDDADLQRLEAISIYGSFDQVYTQDIMEWYAEYGPSHIEWLHDCACNVVFADPISAKRAMLGLTREIPLIEGFEEIIQDLRNKGYTCGTFPLREGGAHQYRFFLVRVGAVTDVKVDDPECNTRKGYDPSRVAGGRRKFRAKRVVDRIRRVAERNANGGDDGENITGKRRQRDDDEDGDDAMGTSGAAGAGAAASADEEHTSKRTRRMEEDEEGHEDE